ncbi:acyl-CoA thioesterase [Pullulanibacillus sp. KACC 23026]|uniref:acyl-CoA thioesterase n=1 Tax=Pullulanibacillus sp. KACC 23026 TaxID=3028315 RepID=UPI0023AE7FAF|nr:acyl-CoA thioesterase [Pullulanibacillus sp. KACC 23026]WEG13903.1 acyl-CoA thioesterase [Pullulanibacillus sp. KACC 23026]
MKTHAKLRVRYSETDQMGIVHHSQYINWFEVGRTHHIRELGHTYREIETAGFYLPVIGVHVTYHTPALYEDVIRIETEIHSYNGVRLHFKYRAVREEDGELVAEGITEHCWTTTDMRPCKMQRKWPELHQKIEKDFKEFS